MRNIPFESEFVIPINYKGLEFDTELRCDILIDNILPVELKAVEEIHPVHEAQLLTYMKLLKAPEGLLINFNVTNIFYEGQRTYVNERFSLLPEI